MTTSLEDIVNMDMLGLTNELSDNDQSSPDSAFLAMPPTPPQPTVDPTNVADLFKFYFDQHMTELQKQQQQQQQTQQHQPLPFSFGSPLFAQPTQTSQQPDPNFFAIDPALMSTVSSTSKAANVAAASKSAAAAARSASSVAGDDEDEELLDEDDDDIEQFLARPVKVGGRGKAAGRKGTISAGGIKKFGGQAVKDSDDPEDWRPTVEQYKKMTPKEKRQLRNKISARNFRVRRKEYITTLEGDVAERDKLIDLIRDELGATKLENESLKREVDALKKALLEGRVELDLPPPGPLSPATTNASNKRTTRSALAKPNTRKDVARSGSSFWGGVAGAGGVAQVHTTLVPDFSFDDIQENMNPALNAACRPEAMVNSICEPMAKDSTFDQFTDANPFTMRSLDQYRMQMWGRLAREAGPGTLNAALGINAASAFAQSPSAGSSPRSTVPGLMSSPSGTSSNGSIHSSPSPPPMAFTSSLLPLGFAQTYSGEQQLGINGEPHQTMPHPILSPTSSPLQGHAAHTKPLFHSPMPTADRAAPPQMLSELVGSKPKQASSSSNLAAAAKPEHAIIATLASQTLLAKMRDAFWDAFAGPSTSTSTAETKKKDWDAEKVRRVLDGTAVVRVVDVEPEQKTVEDPAAALEESMRAMSLQRNTLATVQMQTGGKKDVATSNAGVDALTGVFSNLRLARTGTARS